MADKQFCEHCSGAVVEGACEDCGRPAGKVSLLPAAATSASTDTAKVTSRSTRHFTVNALSHRRGAVGVTSRRAAHTSHTSTRRNALGGGLISLPDQPSQDPLKLVMPVAEVPERKRRCPECEAKVNRLKGFCGSCGKPYDFNPRLKKGDVLLDKYEIKGALAFGGLGWIYLGWDRLLSRWVVLKGLLNSNDAASAAAAVSERQFLAAVKHAKIVGIYDFIHHHSEGYIVMEFVGGITVQSLRDKGPLPVEEAIAYILGILPAFGYLHSLNTVYCDFKPDNLMIEGGDVKLIDMGAVRKIGDPNGNIYGTTGFMAPEANDDPRAVSDLYTVGRTLAMLIMDFKFNKEFKDKLPGPDDFQVLAEHESLYRFLLRATHQDPDERFQTADEMADQLFGVLREIVALRSEPKPVDSKVFTGDHLLAHTNLNLMQEPVASDLPTIRVDMNERSCSEVMRALGIGNIEVRIGELRKIAERYSRRTSEPRIRLAEGLLSTAVGREEGLLTLEQAEKDDPFDWRVQWFRGLAHLTAGEGRPAMECFERVYFEMPGEIAPRLAMGFAAEVAGEYDPASHYYDRVSRVDPGYVTANFGLARCYSKLNRVEDAIAALKRVPVTHSLHHVAMLAVVDLVVNAKGPLTPQRVTAAEEAMSAALPEGGIALPIAGKLLAHVAGQKDIGSLARIAGKKFLTLEFNERALRSGAEIYFRRAAKQALGLEERTRMVTLANQVRPTTLF